jgi:hypothetical protein
MKSPCVISQAQRKKAVTVLYAGKDIDTLEQKTDVTNALK